MIKTRDITGPCIRFWNGIEEHVLFSRPGKRDIELYLEDIDGRKKYNDLMMGLIHCPFDFPYTKMFSFYWIHADFPVSHLVWFLKSYSKQLSKCKAWTDYLKELQETNHD